MHNNFVVDCKGYKLVLGKNICVMGILNVTPDSFSDGGLFFNYKNAVKRAIEIEKEGAGILDIGAESTRPGSVGVPTAEQIRRVIPVIKALKKKISIPISIDTSDAVVALEAVKAGASIINDITGLRKDKNIARVAAKYKTGLCIMHIKGTPNDMQQAPSYKNLMKEICAWLKEGMDIARHSGVKEKRIIIDPGIGFGKTVKHNLQIIKNLSLLNNLGRPVLVGPSRKSFIGNILGLTVDQRLIGTVSAAVLCRAAGASIIRAHDVKKIKEALIIADAILGA